MNTNADETPDRDELRDQLVDAALREVVGGQGPPDLRERILAQARSERSLERARSQAAVSLGSLRSAWRRSSWRMLAIAATILIVVAGLLLPRVQTDREVARKADATGAATAAAVLSEEERTALSALPASGRVPQELTTSKGERSSQSAGEHAGESLAAADDNASAFTELPLPENGGLMAQGQGRFALDNRAIVDAPLIQGAGQQAREAFGMEQQLLSATDTDGLAAAPAVNAPMAQTPLRKWHSTSDSVEHFERQRQLQHRRVPARGRERGGATGRTFGYYQPDGGRGPGLGGDKYQQIVENSFKAVSTENTDNRLSTFSIDVDTASYANVRQFLRDGSLPPADAVRIEELVNYFDYDYSPPTGDVPFAAHIEVAGCPWTPEHRLVRIGIKGREIERGARPKSNLVFLVDVSGSMDEPNKLPLLVDGLRMMTRELGENDRVAIVVYASSEGLALESTRGTDQSKILAALDQLTAGGSTAGGAGIQLAYKVAAENFIKGGVNRVILCTDGDFNVGVTSPAELERIAAKEAKETGVFLTVLGFGRGNLNDAMMEQVADRGNGNYHYVDSRKEARKVLVEEMSGTLVTIAKDVKLQVEFNPAEVAGYRLIGYENRVLAAEDFNDDTKDAGEIGAGHTVTALYEVVPAGKSVDTTEVDELRYGAPKTEVAARGEEESDSGASSDELLTLKIRYKAPDGDESSKLEFPVSDDGHRFAAASDDFKFAAAAASFGMLLRDSQFKGNATYAAVAEIAEAASKSRDPHGYREEFVELVERAKALSGE